METVDNLTHVIDELTQKTDGVDQWNGAHHYDWTSINETDHFVQFYEADGFLLNSLSGYVGGAIKSGDAALVVATKAHREGLDELLVANGIDISSAKGTGQFVSIDANETLATFMVDGIPNEQLFHQSLGSILLSVTDGRSRVRAFGEMVALLWEQGNYNGAIRLEELWNELQQTHSFSLFCAYPMNSLGRDGLADMHQSVCGVHSRVFPAESYSNLQNPDARLRAIARLQQQASALESEIQERKKVEASLRHVTDELQQMLSRTEMARAEAETANRMKDEFLATVSHELRTPLNAIMGWSHLLKTGALDESTVSRAIETIDRNARSQAQLIEDILDVSRMITGKLRLAQEQVDIVSVINAAVDSVQLAIEAKEIQLQLTIDPRARHTTGDASRLQQVVWNLLSNAIKFTPTGGRIEVEVKRAGSKVQIRVSDTGQGIGGEFLPHIFERFRQADGTTTRQHGGLGLGLAIVRHLVELHGGTIKAESEGQDRGATFTVRLPLAPPTRSHRKQAREQIVIGEPATPGTERVASLPSLEDVRILVVDDDHDTVQILSVMLEDARAKVEKANSVSDALEILEWYRPDVVVSDLAMPGEDGYSFIRKLRELDATNGTNTPAVALTSYVRVEDRTRALAAGFNMFVPKPVQPGELINAIANLAEPEN